MHSFNISIFLLCCLLFSWQENRGQEIGKNINYRKEMRDFVIEISESARVENPSFIVIPQNGVQLILQNRDVSDIGPREYLNAIDAVAQEDLFYGYPEINKLTPTSENSYLRSYLDFAKINTKKVLVIDYSSKPTLIEKSYKLNKENHYTSFTAPRRELDIIPSYPVNNENAEDINNLSEVRNFLYLLNYAEYGNKQELITELAFTNYDLLILDAFFQDKAFTAEEIQKLKRKRNGGERLVLAYMSIGEAEDYRFYWNQSWNYKTPGWFVEENPYWKGNYKVKYWDKDWKKIIYGNEVSYLTKIINSAFDGVYLDIIDGFYYFETKE